MTCLVFSLKHQLDQSDSFSCFFVIKYLLDQDAGSLKLQRCDVGCDLPDCFFFVFCLHVPITSQGKYMSFIMYRKESLDCPGTSTTDIFLYIHKDKTKKQQQHISTVQLREFKGCFFLSLLKFITINSQKTTRTASDVVHSCSIITL